MTCARLAPLVTLLTLTTLAEPATATEPAPAGTTTAPATYTLASTPTSPSVLTALNRAAHPLRTTEPGGDTSDLRALDRAIGGARVVGLGEATHGSHEFFALKARVFRHLVEKKGFRTFALEAPWSTGRRLDAYVVHGEGDDIAWTGPEVYDEVEAYVAEHSPELRTRSARRAPSGRRGR
ncbi:erythromycin esterase family protein [Streptomyces sp. NPDC004539]|uniref:erythromycin esterase family protein n=1 Tax=Streptomyces sp. NPDC004539 TaxID=3154280 RepID=UPI0033BE725C